MNKRKPKVGKKNEFNSEDRISQLPDDVLVRILSLFTVKELVVFSTLSRRWESACNSLWKSTMNLNFDARYTSHALYPENPRRVMKDQRPNFIRWVNSVVEKHEGPKIDQFKVCFDLNSAFKYHIDRWIKLAMQKDVQKLELDFSKFKFYTRNEAAFYTFPSRLLRLKNLGFQSLQVLHFKRVEVSEKIFEQFLTNCPLLERFIVCKSPSLYGVRVDGLSLKLKHLEIKKCLSLISIEVFCAPNLVSLCFDGSVKLLTVRNVPKLVELSMNWFYKGSSFIMFAFDRLLCCLHQLESLNINMGSQKYYNDQVIPKSTNLKHLQLGFDLMSMYRFGLLQLHSFMTAFPGLHRLVLVLRPDFVELTKFAEAPKCCHSSLKVVEILGYSGGDRDVEFVVYVIENAVSLEKLVIDPRIYDIYRPYLSSFSFSIDIELEKEGRAHAMEKLQPKVPKTVEFVCL